MSDPECASLAAGAGWAVASVGYRLAPEHPFPVPAQDCYTALTWLVERSAELGLDAAHLALDGTSSGAGLIAAVALMARDRCGPPISLQVLEVPALDPTMASWRDDPDATWLFSRAQMEQGYTFHVPNAADRADPYANPLRADPAGLPPALILTAQHDGLRADAETYAARLVAAGVPADLHVYPGMTHAFTSFTAVLEEAADARGRIVRALQDIITPQRSTP